MFNTKLQTREVSTNVCTEVSGNRELGDSRDNPMDRMDRMAPMRDCTKRQICNQKDERFSRSSIFLRFVD